MSYADETRILGPADRPGRSFPLLAAAILAPAFWAACGLAAEIEATVTEVAGSIAKVSVHSEYLPNPGDAVEIYYVLPEVQEEALVTTGRVSRAGLDAVVVTIDEAAAKARPGYRARIKSPSPRKKSDLLRAAAERELDASDPHQSADRPGFLGVFVRTPTEAETRGAGLDAVRGAVVAGVWPGLAAEEAGLREGDLLLTIHGTEPQGDSGARLVGTVGEGAPDGPVMPGEKVAVTLVRDGQRRTIHAALSILPSASERRRGLLAMAEAGNAAAQLRLGEEYLYGQGVANDPEEAFTWLRKAADAGARDAQYHVARMYYEGAGVNRDLRAMFTWLTRAADGGDERAQYLMGKMYQQGQVVGQDLSQAAAWYRRATERGMPVAQYALGRLYRHGAGVEQDHAQAARLFHAAAEKGHAAAQFNLGLMYEHGQGVPQNVREAFNWFHKAAKQKLPLGQYAVGRMCWEGKGVQRNRPVAIQWWRLAAEQGYAPSQYAIGMAYESGQGVEQDYRRALDWYYRAAKQDMADAQINLGSMIVQGKGARKDYATAVDWFRRAATLNHPLGYYNLGVMYQNGWGVPKDKTEAVTYFLLASDRGNQKAKQALAKLGVNPNE
jgi:TPR repeat protein